MDLTALPTQVSDYNHANPSPSAPLSSHEAQEPSLDPNLSTPVASNIIVLAHTLKDTAISWRIHNCKISEKTVTQDQPLPFLYHYDSLEDSIKEAHPLTPQLLAQFNTSMSAHEAAKLIGIDSQLLRNPWHVKVVGSLVVFSEALQLAVRLHWTNTGKSAQQLYTKTAEEALMAAFKEWQFFGRIDVLYKNDQQTLITFDEQAENDEQIRAIPTGADYQQLPAAHALPIIAALEADKAQLPWFETAILARLE